VYTHSKPCDSMTRAERGWAGPSATIVRPLATSWRRRARRAGKEESGRMLVWSLIATSRPRAGSSRLFEKRLSRAKPSLACGSPPPCQGARSLDLQQVRREVLLAEGLEIDFVAGLDALLLGERLLGEVG